MRAVRAVGSFKSFLSFGRRAWLAAHTAKRRPCELDYHSQFAVNEWQNRARSASAPRPQGLEKVCTRTRPVLRTRCRVMDRSRPGSRHSVGVNQLDSCACLRERPSIPSRSRLMAMLRALRFPRSRQCASKRACQQGRCCIKFSSFQTRGVVSSCSCKQCECVRAAHWSHKPRRQRLRGLRPESDRRYQADPG